MRPDSEKLRAMLSRITVGDSRLAREGNVSSGIGMSIEICEVRKEFRNLRDPANSVVVLDALSLNIASGEFVTIVGPSGCGKTTLLMCIAGLEPYEGTILLDGSLVKGPQEGVAVVFQAPSLLPWRTARANARYGLEAQVSRPRRVKKELDARAVEALKQVGLPQDAWNRYPDQLSGGMQQRINIARALATQPRLLLMDEPFGALDAITRGRLQVEFDRLSASIGITNVFITHDLEEAIYLGDRVIVMGSSMGAIREERRIELPHPRDLELKFSEQFKRLLRDLHRTLG